MGSSKIPERLMFAVWVLILAWATGLAAGATAQETAVQETAAQKTAAQEGRPKGKTTASRTGTVEFQPAAEESSRVPEIFRQEAARFDFQQEYLSSVSRHFERSLVTFPSPVVTPLERNNTVHCEYFRPTGPGPHPGCIVLHILGGDFELSRLFCAALAQQGVSALFVKMPYYGPRRDPALREARMISRDPHGTVAGMTQAVLDIRRAAAWLRDQPEVDADQVGIFGISLGGITGALAFTAEPRFHRAGLLLAGGDASLVADEVWEHPLFAEIRLQWEAKGETKESFVELMRQVDPVTYAENVQSRPVLMLNARQDEIIPPKCSEALWRAFGEQEIHWYQAGHITAALHIADSLLRVTKFFAPAKTSMP